MGNKYSSNFINGELDISQSKKDLEYIRYLEIFNHRKYRYIFSDPYTESDKIREYVYNMRKKDPSSNLEARCSIWSIRSDRLSKYKTQNTQQTQNKVTSQPYISYQNQSQNQQKQQPYVSYQNQYQNQPQKQPSAPSAY